MTSKSSEKKEKKKKKKFQITYKSLRKTYTRT